MQNSLSTHMTYMTLYMYVVGRRWKFFFKILGDTAFLFHILWTCIICFLAASSCS